MGQQLDLKGAPDDISHDMTQHGINATRSVYSESGAGLRRESWNLFQEEYIRT